MQFISKRTLKFCVLVTFSIFWKSACATILRNFNEAREWSFLRSSITVFPTQSIFWNVMDWKILSIFMYSILLRVDAGLFSLFGMRHSWQHWHPKLQLQKVEVFFIFTEFWAFQDHFYFGNVLRCRRKKLFELFIFSMPFYMSVKLEFSSSFMT